MVKHPLFSVVNTKRHLDCLVLREKVIWRLGNFSNVLNIPPFCAFQFFSPLDPVGEPAPWGVRVGVAEESSDDPDRGFCMVDELGFALVESLSVGFAPGGEV